MESDKHPTVRVDHSLEFEGQRRQLVSDSAARAVLRLLRERTKAELICVDASYAKIYRGSGLADTTQLPS